MAEPADHQTKDKPGWKKGEHTELKPDVESVIELKPAGETEEELIKSVDELKPAEENVHELKPAEVSVTELDELSDTTLELNKLSELDLELNDLNQLSDTTQGRAEMNESDTEAAMDLAGQVIFGPKEKMNQICFSGPKRSSKPKLRIHYLSLMDQPRNSSPRNHFDLFWIKLPKKKYCSPWKVHNKFIMGLFLTKFDQAFHQIVSDPFHQENIRKKSRNQSWSWHTKSSSKTSQNSTSRFYKSLQS